MFPNCESLSFLFGLPPAGPRFLKRPAEADTLTKALPVIYRIESVLQCLTDKAECYCHYRTEASCIKTGIFPD